MPDKIFLKSEQINCTIFKKVLHDAHDACMTLCMTNRHANHHARVMHVMQRHAAASCTRHARHAGGINRFSFSHAAPLHCWTAAGATTMAEELVVAPAALQQCREESGSS